MERDNLPQVRVRQIEGLPPRFTRDELARTAVCYARVFAGEPWNEVSRCRNGFSSMPAGSQCEECGEVRSEAYPLEEQMEKIAGELIRPGAACFLLEDEQSDEVVGFSWSFSYSGVDEFIDEKYAGTGEKSEQLQRDVRRILGRYAISSEPFYYLSETGIINDTRYRGRGISKEFVRLRSEVAEDLALDMVQRTNIESPMFRTMQGSGFTQVMGENIGEADLVNPQRVLFIKKAER